MLLATGVGGGFSTCWKIASNTGPACLAEIGHEWPEFAVEVAEKQQSLLVEDREARGVNGADRIRLPENSPGIRVGKLLRQRLRIRGRISRET